MLTGITIGGTVSDATGGKFANGAITAAYGNLFNPQDAASKKEKFIKSVKIGVTIKGPKGFSATLTTDESGNATVSAQQKNSIVTSSIDSSGIEVKLTFLERVKSFLESIKSSFVPVDVNEDGNLVFKGSVRVAAAEVEVDVSAPIKNSPVGQILQNPTLRRECAAGTIISGCDL